MEQRIPCLACSRHWAQVKWPAVSTWANYLTSLCLTSFICIVRIIIVCPSQSYLTVPGYGTYSQVLALRIILPFSFDVNDTFLAVRKEIIERIIFCLLNFEMGYTSHVFGGVDCCPRIGALWIWATSASSAVQSLLVWNGDNRHFSWFAVSLPCNLMFGAFPSMIHGGWGK